MTNTTTYTLVLTEDQHRLLKKHLFPQGGNEAIAFAFCGRRAGDNKHKLLVREVHLVPYEHCSERTSTSLKWSTRVLPSLLEKAIKKEQSVLKIHSHPNFHPDFSGTDDTANQELFSSIHVWTDNAYPHASAIMLQDGKLIGRAIMPTGETSSIQAIHIVGDDLLLDFTGQYETIPEFGKRVSQSFGEGTYNLLRRLKVGVIGCSGTGSIVIEQLARNCVGELLLVDPDLVEEKNLNRLPNTTMQDARDRRAKVDVFARSIAAMEFGTKVNVIHGDLIDPQTILSVAECDIVFGCMDSVEGRHILNRLASFYMLPYFDLGVKLIADGKGGVEEVCGTVHYLKPGGSSLLSRRVYTNEQLRAESLYKRDPATYKSHNAEGYIENVHQEKPAVISVNMLVASMAINEFLARIHPYRAEPNSRFAVNGFSLTNCFFYNENDGSPCESLSKHVGRGDINPLLDMPQLSDRSKK